MVYSYNAPFDPWFWQMENLTDTYLYLGDCSWLRPSKAEEKEGDWLCVEMGTGRAKTEERLAGGATPHKTRLG